MNKMIEFDVYFNSLIEWTNLKSYGDEGKKSKICPTPFSQRLSK